MKGHLTDEDVHSFRHSSLEPQSLLRLDRHLASCGSCRSKVLKETAPVLPALICDLDEALHLNYEQISAFLDDRMGPPEREAAAAHLGICKDCNRELSELSKFDSMAETAAREKPIPARLQPWWAILLTHLQSPALRFAPGVAVALGLLLGVPLFFQSGTAASGSLDAGASALRNSFFQQTSYVFSSHTGQAWTASLLVALGAALVLLRRLTRRR